MAIQNKTLSPNRKQRLAIEHPPSPLMILAGAGTGKTFTLENRIVYLIEYYKVEPKHILAITYTEKAAQELKSRVIEKVGPIAHSMTVNTFHALCYKILTEHKGHSLQLLEESEAIHLFINQYDELGPFESDEFALNPYKAINESFIPFFNRMRDELIDIEKMGLPRSSEEGPITTEIVNQLKDLKRIFPLFQSWKKEINVIDYGDMIYSAYHILSSNNKVLSNTQDTYRHIIVDEFQDNNFALNEIVDLIAGKRQFITVVGDDDQVIYSFRGANNYNISAFRERYGKHKNYKSISLENNYRSNQKILDLANESIKNNSNRIDKILISKKESTNEKPVIFWGDKGQQIEFLLREIIDLNEGGRKFNEIAILCRTHSQASVIIQRLKQSGIPTSPKYMGLLHSSRVKDIISWCQLISEGSFQDSAIYRLIERICGYQLTNKIFSKFNPFDSTPRFKLIVNDSKLRKEHLKLDKVLSSIQKLKAIAHKRSASEIVWDIAENLNALRPHAKQYLMDDHYELLNVGDFLKRAQNFTHRNRDNDTISAFNNYLETILHSGGISSITPTVYRQQNSVIVNTVHGVKGGEFPIVFIPFLRSASFPLNFRNSMRVNSPPDEWLHPDDKKLLTPKEQHINEERRLFYVATTRAKEKLYLLAPKKATSIFIKELSNKLMEDQEMSIKNTNINSHSNLKVKYEDKLQKALMREAYEKVNQYSLALELIHNHEKGLKVEIGNSKWEEELKIDLGQNFQPPVPERINLSASAIETYENCPLKFRLGRIDGIPQSAKKPELTFGNIIHKVLQRFHEKGKELSRKRILRLLEEEWMPNEFDYAVREEKFKEQGIEILKRYQKIIDINHPEVLRTEESFSFEIGPVTIRGAIDRIDKTTEGIEILDYKTSKSSTQAKSNLQLAIYSMYLEQSNDNEIKGLPASSSLYFLRDQEKPLRSHSFTKEEIYTTKEKILDVANNIRKKEFSAKTGKHCDWCDYKKLVCPSWEQ